MDTRYWGPSGWQLLHLMAAANVKQPTFWNTLPFVLPCKFCRASLSIYYEKHPPPLHTSEPMDQWLYTIHNEVNDKLRSQGQSIDPNPSFSQVKEHYDTLLNQGCTKTVFPGWRFLFSIADNHPDSSPSKPMPDAPTILPKTLKEKNQYNLLTAAERKQQIRKFWASVPSALPFSEWRTAWTKFAGPIQQATEARRSALRWLWTIRCGLDASLHHLTKTSFHGLCKEVATFRSGCATSRNARTCRRLRKQVLKGTRTNKQRQ